MNTCNRLVAGSNPARGAYKILNTPAGVFLILMLPGSKALNVPYVRIRSPIEHFYD